MKIPTESLIREARTAVQNRFGIIAQSHDQARAVFAEFRAVLTAVFAETGINGVFADWDFTDPLCQKLDEKIPQLYDGLRVAHLAVHYPNAKHVARFVFFVNIDHKSKASLCYTRCLPAGSILETIEEHCLSTRISAFACACADISKGKGVPSGF